MQANRLDVERVGYPNCYEMFELSCKEGLALEKNKLWMYRCGTAHRAQANKPYFSTRLGRSDNVKREAKTSFVHI